MNGIDTLSRRTKAILMATIGLVLLWLVITGNFAAYLALEAPETALRLRADEPTALVILADRWLNLGPGSNAADGARGPTPSKDDGTASREVGDRLGGWAEIALRATVGRFASDQAPSETQSDPQSSPPVISEADRRLIRSKAERALLRDPINPRALRILGQLADDAGEEVRAAKFMKAAADLSLHESTAVYWLMRKGLTDGNFSSVAKYTDALLRQRPQLITSVMPILVRLAENTDQHASTELKMRLASNPPWRTSFFSRLPDFVSDARTPLDLLLSLKETPTPPTANDLAPYLRFLIARGFFDLAYYTWLQFLPPEQLTRVGLLFNSGFESPPSGLPFDWVISPGTGVTIDMAQRADHKDDRALFLEFGPGRAEFGGVSQLLMLPPGTYKLMGKFKGELRGRRGLQWQIACAARDEPLAESPMFIGVEPLWTDFDMKFSVPNADCRAQELSLVLAARSASEQLVSGTIWYDELRIALVAKAQSPQPPATGLDAGPPPR